MQIEKVTVRAGRCVPHPLHSYGNLKADLEIVARIEEGDDPEKIRLELQAKIESDVEQHVADLKEGIRDLQAVSGQRERIKRLEAEVSAKNAELEEMRKGFQELPLLAHRRA